MSTETSEWQILSFCYALKCRYSFIGYATLPTVCPIFVEIFLDMIVRRVLISKLRDLRNLEEEVSAENSSSIVRFW